MSALLVARQGELYRTSHVPTKKSLVTTKCKPRLNFGALANARRNVSRRPGVSPRANFVREALRRRVHSRHAFNAHGFPAQRPGNPFALLSSRPHLGGWRCEEQRGSGPGHDHDGASYPQSQGTPRARGIQRQARDRRRGSGTGAPGHGLSEGDARIVGIITQLLSRLRLLPRGAAFFGGVRADILRRSRTLASYQVVEGPSSERGRGRGRQAGRGGVPGQGNLGAKVPRRRLHRPRLVRARAGPGAEERRGKARG